MSKMSSVFAIDYDNYGIDEFTKAEVQIPSDTTTLSKQATMEEAMAEHTRNFFFMSSAGRVGVEVFGTEMICGLVQDIGRLMALEKNWDSYDAPPIDPHIAIAAMKFWLINFGARFPKPWVVPTNEGGIQFEWHKGGLDVEAEFRSRNEILGYYRDKETGKEWEGDISRDFEPFKKVLSRMITDRY